jgi:hypothetical protein
MSVLSLLSTFNIPDLLPSIVVVLCRVRLLVFASCCPCLYCNTPQSLPPTRITNTFSGVSSLLRAEYTAMTLSVGLVDERNPADRLQQPSAPVFLHQLSGTTQGWECRVNTVQQNDIIKNILFFMV